MPYKNVTEPLFAPLDAPLFLAIADSFSLQATQRWEQRFNVEKWQQTARQAQSLLARFELMGADALPMLTPPTRDEHDKFAQCHLVAGKAWALMPLEQTYRQRAVALPKNSSRKSNQRISAASCSSPFYIGNIDAVDNRIVSAKMTNAQRETSLISVGIYFAKTLGERPDHLSVMLTFLAFLLHNKMLKEAHLYLHEHLEWLAEYRSDLAHVAPYAWFYTLLLDLIIHIKASSSQDFFCKMSGRFGARFGVQLTHEQ